MRAQEEALPLRSSASSCAWDLSAWGSLFNVPQGSLFLFPFPAESVAAARALFRRAREDGADLDSFLAGVGHLATLIVRTSAHALI